MRCYMDHCPSSSMPSTLQSVNRTDSTPAPTTSRTSHARRWWMLVLPIVPLLAIVALWYFADLGRFRSPEQLAGAARSLRESPLGFVYVLLAFAAGTLLFIPLNGLILGTTLAFDAAHGFAYAFAGALLGASLNYWIGRFMGSRPLDYFSGPRIGRFREELRNHAFRASIAARLLPVGNFTMINLLAGSLRIPFRAFFLGNVVGILPGVLVLTFFSDQITAAFRSGSPRDWLLPGLGLLLVIVLFALRRRVLRRRASQPLATSGELSS